MINAIARYKNYLARSNGYLLVATFGLSLRNIFTDWKIIPAFILGLVFMLFLGFMDYKLGLFKAESLHMARQNPILLEILNEVRKWTKSLKNYIPNTNRDKLLD